MSNFNKIWQWFKDNMRSTYIEDIYNSNGSIFVQTKCEIYLIVEPHDDLEQWMLRIALRPTFDRWANSTVVEVFFNSEDEIINYLETNQLEFYKVLLENACEELEDMYNK